MTTFPKLYLRIVHRFYTSIIDNVYGNTSTEVKPYEKILNYLSLSCPNPKATVSEPIFRTPNMASLQQPTPINTTPRRGLPWDLAGNERD